MSNYFNLGSNQIIDNKTAYNPEGRNKLTYNFVTDPRLRRGHNYGVIYVTSSNYDENNISSNNNNILQQQSQTQYKSGKAKLKSINYKNQKNLKKIEYQNKYENDGFGVYTEKVTTTERPKPITFEEIIQTDPLPQRPLSPLIWPKKTGIDVETQVNDGDLFNFYEEVTPLVQVIVSKTLEDSRREVLEEEELAEIKEQENKYIKYNKEDEERVKDLENVEKNKYSLKISKNEKKKRKIEMTKKFQKKLISRKKAKNYISRLFKDTSDNLKKRGMFKNPENNDFFTDLLPELQNIAEEFNKNDYYIVNNLQEMLCKKNYTNSLNSHKTAIINEKNRLAKNEEIRNILKKREEERKEREREERRKRRHEKLMDQFRQKITEELMPNSEWLEDSNVENIFEINGYYQKANNVTCIGGPIGQISFTFCILNKLIPNYSTDEKILKILDTYLEKSHQFIFIFKAEDLEAFKEMDENIETIEDITKAEDDKYKSIEDKIYENTLVNDDMLKYIFDVAKDCGLDDFEEIYKKIFYIFLDKYKDGSDFGSVKFIQFEQPNDEEVPLECIVSLKPEKIEIPQEDDKKPKKIFEHFFSERILIMPTICDKFRIININGEFDRIFKKNFFDCVDFAYKFDDEENKIKYIEEINNEYEKLMKGLLIKLSQTFNKEIVEMGVGLPKEGEEEEEENND